MSKLYFGRGFFALVISFTVAIVLDLRVNRLYSLYILDSGLNSGLPLVCAVGLGGERP